MTFWQEWIMWTRKLEFWRTIEFHSFVNFILSTSSILDQIWSVSIFEVTEIRRILLYLLFK